MGFFLVYGVKARQVWAKILARVCANARAMTMHLIQIWFGGKNVIMHTITYPIFVIYSFFSTAAV